MRKRSTNLYKQLEKRVMSDPEMRQIAEEHDLQLRIASALKRARLKRGLTQEMLAKKMSTTRSAVSRLESGGGSARHAPSLSTLNRYASALGYNINITLRDNGPL